jgi:tetratricopeptide (TPR) repeat protein
MSEAKIEFQEVIALNPSSPWSYGGMCWALVLEGDFDQALQYAQKSALPWARRFGVALAQSGRHDAAAADGALAELIKSDADVAAYQIAEVYAFRGNSDQAFEWLERAFRQRDPGLAWLQPDRLFNQIHGDVRWIPMVRKVGLADDQLP